jgi:hypothetical protein
MSEHEPELEASLLRTGGSLRAFYAGRWSLGRLWSHVLAAPYDAPVWGVLTRWDREAKDRAEVRALDDTLAMVDPRHAERDSLNRTLREAELGDAAGDKEGGDV